MFYNLLRIKNLFFLFFISSYFLLLLSSQDFLLAMPIANTPLIFNCHGGNCNWYKIIGKKLIKSHNQGKLYLVKIKTGLDKRTYGPDDEYPKIYKNNIHVHWQKKTWSNYVLCHPKIHYVKYEGYKEGVLLEFNSTPDEGAYGQYLTICYNLKNGLDAYYKGFAEDRKLQVFYDDKNSAMQYGFADNLREKVKIISPAEIFHYIDIPR